MKNVVLALRAPFQIAESLLQLIILFTRLVIPILFAGFVEIG
jgi:hypothetical protein